MPLPDAPHIVLLKAVRSALAGVDYADLAGYAGSQPVAVRHARGRSTMKTERPCIAIVFVNDSPRPDELNRSMDETVRELEIDLVCDLALASEESGDDVTGHDMASQILAAALTGLRDADEEIYLGGLCDYVTAGAVAPDDNSTADDGRLVRGITVLYRVRSNDANVLLAAGEV